MLIKKATYCLLAVALARPVVAANVALSVNAETQLVEVVSDARPTTSVIWDRIAQSYVVSESIGPTLAAAAYGTMHTAIYNAWALFVDDAKPYGFKRRRPIADAYRTYDNKIKTMTQAAFFVLKNLFPNKQKELHLELQRQGMDNIQGIPLRVGTKVAESVLRTYSQRRRTERKESNMRYAPFTSEVDLWTPEHIPIDDTNGPLQKFLTPKFGNLKTFGIENGASFRPPRPKPFLLVNGTVDVDSKTIQVEGGKKQQVSNSMIGTIINPDFIYQCEEVVEYSRNLNDRTKVIAEFWEDGGGTSFPPGTWMTFGQYISARDDHSIDDDAKMFLALGNAIRDAAIASWNAKMFYFYARPIRAIRDLGKLGLIGNFSDSLGGQAIEAYDIPNRKAGTIRAGDWTTYQTPGSHPSPPFPEYTSGHSGFSGAAAEVLKRFTKSDDFGASVTIYKGESRFEPGTTPSEDITLEWITFTDAAEEAGISRLHGGIHFMDGNTYGKEIGENVGAQVFQVAQDLFDRSY